MRLTFLLSTPFISAIKRSEAPSFFKPRATHLASTIDVAQIRFAQQ